MRNSIRSLIGEAGAAHCIEIPNPDITDEGPLPGDAGKAV